MSSEHQKARARGRYGETRLIKKLGGVKVGLQKTIILQGKVIEIPSDKHPDIIFAKTCAEIKYCAKESTMVRNAVDQAVRNCLDGYLPIAITGKKNPIVHVLLKDWLAWYG